VNLDSLTKSLLAGYSGELLQTGIAGPVTSITSDSRSAGPGSVFVALKGEKADGHDFLSVVVKQGCVCVVVEKNCVTLPTDVTVIRVDDTRSALGALAADFYGFPARELTMIGLTGTNGKTTVSWLLEWMLKNIGCQVGVIGTINYRYFAKDGHEVCVPAPLTTPEPLLLQKLLRSMVDEGVTHVIMETSSHALVQQRLQGILFDVGVFTNLSRDHLDFHGSMEEYFAAKKLLFTRYLKKTGSAVVVTDSGTARENWGQQLLTELLNGEQTLNLVSCGFDKKNMVSLQELQMDLFGFSGQLNIAEQQFAFQTEMTGRYNVLNFLSAASVGTSLGLPGARIISGLKAARQAPGRLEKVNIPGKPQRLQPHVFVDYAHTPDALDNVLQTLRKLTEGRLICLFGCGGDRDKGKRSQMGEIAGEQADISIVTSDNPRSEDPEEIISSIATGLKKVGIFEEDEYERLKRGSKTEKRFICLADRKEAIRAAIDLACPGDIVLIAGKGHETYQLVGKKRIFFDDRISALEAMIAWTPSHLLEATRGQVCGGEQISLLHNISTDTRKLERGDIFIALSGETFDGHDYVETAVKAGALAVIVHKEIPQLPDNILVIRVKDSLRALGDLARYRRELLKPRVKVAAITGSSGKTTVKEMTSAIFRIFFENENSGKDSLLQTVGNFNNLIGLPLSLLPLSARHKTAVLEMGMNRPGEIERLTAIADPDIGCITNIQSAHLEGLGSIEGVARAKGELFNGMRPDTVCVVNYDDAHVRRLKRNGQAVIGFAVTSGGRRNRPAVRATRIVNRGEQGMRFTLHVDDWKKRIDVPVPGKHNVSNCAAAAAITHAAGVSPDIIVEGLKQYQSTEKRMQFMALPGGLQVLNDCYNANPASMQAALRTVSSFGKGCKKIALLGDMLELGENSEQAHEELGQQVAENRFDTLLVTGSFAHQVVRGAGSGGMTAERIHIFSGHTEIVDWLYQALVQRTIVDGDWLLVKGSRGMKMEKVLQGIAKRFATGIEGQ